MSKKRKGVFGNAPLPMSTSNYERPFRTDERGESHVMVSLDSNRPTLLTTSDVFRINIHSKSGTSPRNPGWMFYVTHSHHGHNIGTKFAKNGQYFVWAHEIKHDNQLILQQLRKQVSEMEITKCKLLYREISDIIMQRSFIIKHHIGGEEIPLEYAFQPDTNILSYGSCTKETYLIDIYVTIDTSKNTNSKYDSVYQTAGVALPCFSSDFANKHKCPIRKVALFSIVGTSMVPERIESYFVFDWDHSDIDQLTDKQLLASWETEDEHSRPSNKLPMKAILYHQRKNLQIKKEEAFSMSLENDLHHIIKEEFMHEIYSVLPFT